MNDKVKHLRKMLFEGTHKQYRVDSLGISILNEETQKLSYPIRKAMAFAKCLQTMPIFIQKGEIIVGGKTVYELPEFITKKEIEVGNHNIEIEGYDNIFDIVFNLGQDARGFGIANSGAPAYYRAVPMGFPAFLEEAEQKKQAAKDKESVDFYESIAICIRGVIILIKRFEKLALEQMANETDSKRAQELHKMAVMLGSIAKRPPEDFYEATQVLYFIQYLLWVEGGYLIPLGRYDQYMLPFYENDIKNGKHTKEQIIEIMECFFIKLNFEIDQTHGGDGKLESDTGQTVTVGGIDPKTGKDVCNDLTILVMDTKLDTRITDPRIHVRFSKKTPQEVWEKSAELTAAGMGFPTYDSDENIIKALTSHEEYSLKDARDYALSGCWEVVIQGKSSNSNLGDIDSLRALEWALNDGYNALEYNKNAKGLRDGKWGLSTGNPESFYTFDDLMRAFYAQMKHNIDTIACNQYKSRMTYSPFYSAVMDDCMETGKDIASGGCRYYETDFQMSSLGNCADALYAIKSLVYEQERLTLPEFIEILKNNYKGHEDLRQEIVNKSPKFGNDQDEVDEIANDIVKFFCREATKHKNAYGGPYRARIASALGYVAIARTLGASADGRYDKDFYGADLSTGLGAERNGPTAVIKSAGKIDTSRLAGGSILDIKFNPNALATKELQAKFINLIKVYFELGGLQVQMNVVDKETLLKAKANPKDYPDLMVRVWGFSTYFISLSEDYQDHIIERTELEL